MIIKCITNVFFILLLDFPSCNFANSLLFVEFLWCIEKLGLLCFVQLQCVRDQKRLDLF